VSSSNVYKGETRQDLESTDLGLAARSSGWAIIQFARSASRRAPPHVEVMATLIRCTVPLPTPNAAAIFEHALLAARQRVAEAAFLYFPCI
jgi:hypothetical protein